MSDVDLKAWLEGARLPETTATVYGRADLVAEIQALDEQLRATAGDGDERLASPRESLAARIEEARHEMRASAMTFRFRAMSAAEWRDIDADLPDDDDESRRVRARRAVAKACVSHELTPDTVDVIRDRIGEGQFSALWDRTWEATNTTRWPVPFSLAASVIQTSQDS